MPQVTIGRRAGGGPAAAAHASPVAHAPSFVLVYGFDAASPAPVLRWTTIGMRTLLGYGSSALGPGWLMDAVHPDDIDMVVASHRAALRGTNELLDARFLAADGAVRHLRGELRPADPLDLDAGGLAHWIDATAEHTARALLARRERELLEARRLAIVGELASGIAHDCGNLLTAIRAYCDLLAPELTAPKARDDIDAIARSADTAAALVRQLVSLGRADAGQPKLVSLDDLVADAERVLIRLVGPGHTLRVDAGRAGLVHADPGTLEHVLLNLVLSAREAMPAGGDIVIATERTAIDAPIARDGAFVPAGAYAAIRVTFERATPVVDTIRDAGLAAHRAGATAHGQDVGSRTPRLREAALAVDAEPPIGMSTATALAARAGGHLIVEEDREARLELRLLVPAIVGAGPARVGEPATDDR